MCNNNDLLNERNIDLVNDRLRYWYKYYEWINSNMESAKEIGRQCVEMVFRKYNIVERRNRLSEAEINEVFGL